MVTAGRPKETRDDPHDLLGRVFRGDAGARTTLVARLMPVIQARVRRRVGGIRSPVEVEDAVQEIWLRLIERRGAALRNYDAGRGATFEGYVGMLAERELGNYIDRTKTKKRGGHMSAVDNQELEARPNSGPNPEEQAASREQLGRLALHLEAELPSKGQLVFRYLYTDGVAANHAASALGVSVQVVYNWQHKIREIARRFLANDLHR